MSILVSSNNNEVYYFAKESLGAGGLSPYFPKHFPHYTNKYLHMENVVDQASWRLQNSSEHKQTRMATVWSYCPNECFVVTEKTPSHMLGGTFIISL